MPPPTAQEVAARALEAAQAAVHAAEIAKMTADTAIKAAEAAKMASESMIREMRERFDRQDEESKEFRDKLMLELVSQNRTFDAFKSDFDTEMDKTDRRCTGHNDALFGNKEKNIEGIVPKVYSHDDWISRFLWTWGVVLSLSCGLGWYIIYFYGDAMKRGVFNASDDEWRWRVSREVRRAVKPEALNQSANFPNPEHTEATPH